MNMTKRQKTEIHKRSELIHTLTMHAYDDVKGTGIYYNGKITFTTVQGDELTVRTFNDNYASLKAVQNDLIKTLRIKIKG